MRKDGALVVDARSKPLRLYLPFVLFLQVQKHLHLQKSRQVRILEFSVKMESLLRCATYLPLFSVFADAAVLAPARAVNVRLLRACPNHNILWILCLFDNLEQLLVSVRLLYLA